MTHAEEVCRGIGINLTPSQIAAARYLEMHGFVFLVHFGYANAGQLAMKHWLNDIPSMGGTRH